MTIGIGLISKNGIILASDSKTETEAGPKRFDLDKISLFEAGNFKCGIVRSGPTGLTAQAVDLIKERAKNSPPSSLFDIRTIVHQSVGDTVRSFASAHPNVPYFADEGRFSLIIGVNDPNPHLYVARSTAIWPSEESSGMACIGTGEILADYILGGLAIRDLKFEEVASAAVFAVEIAKLKDSHCEGPTRLAIVSPTSFGFFPQPMVEESANNASRFEGVNQKDWIKTFMEWSIKNQNLTFL